MLGELTLNSLRNSIKNYKLDSSNKLLTLGEVVKCNNFDVIFDEESILQDDELVSRDAINYELRIDKLVSLDILTRTITYGISSYDINYSFVNSLDSIELISDTLSVLYSDRIHIDVHSKEYGRLVLMKEDLISIAFQINKLNK